MDKELGEWREQIDEINSKIIDLIAERTEIVKKVGDYKNKNKIPICDPSREQKIHEKVEKLAEEKGVDKKFVKELFELILTQAKEEEKCQK